MSTPPLVVSMPETPGQPPLPGAREEAEHLIRAFPGAAHLTGPDATKEAVLAGMTAHSWFRFSAHGTTDEHTPVNGGIELADGRLTIRSLLEHRLPGAQFAFLSACATHHGSAAIPDEIVTTATALCTAGCRHVVATLWPVADDHAADFAARMYEELITTGNGTPTLHPEDTPASCARSAAPSGTPTRITLSGGSRSPVPAPSKPGAPAAMRGAHRAWSNTEPTQNLTTGRGLGHSARIIACVRRPEHRCSHCQGP